MDHYDTISIPIDRVPAYTPFLSLVKCVQSLHIIVIEREVIQQCVRPDARRRC